MPHILKNKNLEVHIDLPQENYNFSRFDRTGKIVNVKFQNIDMTTIERNDDANEDHFGKALYNEFGIDTALGFDETETGGWFHKIGVGLLKKEDPHYLFSKKYEIKPAEFDIFTEADKIKMNCTSPAAGGYAYILKKEIQLFESRFIIKYELQNTGERIISTDEYVHNFMAINKDLIGKNYRLKFPFQLNPEVFAANVNPEDKVDIGQTEIKLNGTPREQFFFSNLSGDEAVTAEWELINRESNIGIRERGSFQTDKVNLWGWRHVISPELFFKIQLQPGESTAWSRTYDVFNIK